jgi:hypothetical protein
MIQKSGPEAVIQASLGFKALCQKLEGISSPKVLELGPARSANIEFWSRYGSSMFIADLRASLPLPFLAEDQQFPESEWDRILGLPEGHFYDVILAWDLLNYIELSTLPALISYLSRFCRLGTILFFLIFDQPQMPEEITVYRIVDEQRIAYESNSAGKRACPRHQPRALTLLLSKFQTSGSFRLKNGIVEYLFVCENL